MFCPFRTREEVEERKPLARRQSSKGKTLSATIVTPHQAMKGTLQDPRLPKFII